MRNKEKGGTAGRKKRGDIYGTTARTRISILLKSMDILARNRSFVCASSLYTTYHVLNSLSLKNNPPAKSRRFAGGYAVNAYKAFGIDSAAFSFSNCSAGYIFLSANPPLYMIFVRKLAVDENPVDSVKLRLSILLAQCLFAFMFAVFLYEQQSYIASLRHGMGIRAFSGVFYVDISFF